MRNGQCFVIMYDITSLASFEDASPMYSWICRVKDTDHVPVVCSPSLDIALPHACQVLVGNKCDLEAARQVSAHEGRALAKTFGNAPFLETSARCNINVNEAMAALIRATPRSGVDYKGMCVYRHRVHASVVGGLISGSGGHGRWRRGEVGIHRPVHPRWASRTSPSHGDLACRRLCR